MTPLAIVNAATGLLGALTEIAKLAGADDTAATLERACAVLRDHRANIDAIHAETDRQLAGREAARLDPSSSLPTRAARYEPEEP